MPLPQLRSFALWLAKHAGLVNSITAKTGHLPWNNVVHGLPCDVHVDEAQRVLHQAMQLAGTMPTPPAAALVSTAAASASSGGNSASQQQGWRLASFSSDLPQRELLAALPAHSLTHLDLHTGSCIPYSGVHNSTIAAALSRLSSLQQLKLVTSGDDMLVSALDGVAQLSRLTALTLHSDQAGIKQLLEQLLVQQLPLRKLEIRIRDYSSSSQPPVLDIKHLTALEELSSCVWPWRGQLPEGSALPAQLEQLQLAKCSESDLEAVMPLQQLQRLDLIIETDSAGE
jgi:hypothetical protein